MDKIKVTPEMRDRIMKNIDNMEIKPLPKSNIFLNNYKKYMSVIACFIIVIFSAVYINKMPNINDHNYKINNGQLNVKKMNKNKSSVKLNKNKDKSFISKQPMSVDDDKNIDKNKMTVIKNDNNIDKKIINKIKQNNNKNRKENDNIRYKRMFKKNQEHQNKKEDKYENTKKFNSKDEISEYVGFEVKNIVNIPFVTQKIKYTSYNNKIAEVTYIGLEKSLVFRMSKEDKNITNYYNYYDNVDKIEKNKIKYTLRGNGKLINLVAWNKDKMSYLISSDKGLSREEIKYIINNI